MCLYYFYPYTFAATIQILALSDMEKNRFPVNQHCQKMLGFVGLCLPCTLLYHRLVNDRAVGQRVARRRVYYLNLALITSRHVAEMLTSFTCPFTANKRGTPCVNCRGTVTTAT